MHSWLMPYIPALSLDHLNFVLYIAYMPSPPLFWGPWYKGNGDILALLERRYYWTIEIGMTKNSQPCVLDNNNAFRIGSPRSDLS